MYYMTTVFCVCMSYIIMYTWWKKKKKRIYILHVVHISMTYIIIIPIHTDIVCKLKKKTHCVSAFPYVLCMDIYYFYNIQWWSDYITNHKFAINFINIFYQKIVEYMSKLFNIIIKTWNFTGEIAGLKVGSLVIEGKTKRVFDLPSRPGHCLLQSKDRITAGDGVKAHDLEGKAAISTLTTSKVFQLLNTAGQWLNNNYLTFNLNHASKYCWFYFIILSHFWIIIFLQCEEQHVIYINIVHYSIIRIVFRLTYFYVFFSHMLSRVLQYVGGSGAIQNTYHILFLSRPNC
jgi:hypothetical protein